MAKKIAFVSGKGGVGKSTLCASAAKSLAKGGKKVLIEEADSGFRCIDIMLNLQDRVVYDMEDIVRYDINPQKAIVAFEENLDYLPASYNADFVPSVNDIKKLNDKFEDEYDFILMDMGYGITEKNAAFIEQADMFLAVLTPDLICVRDTEKLANLIRLHSDGEIRLVINKVNLFGRNQMDNFDEIIDKISARLIAVIPNSLDIMNGKMPNKKSIWQKTVNNLCFRLNNVNIQLAIQ